jgi:putative membrane protein
MTSSAFRMPEPLPNPATQARKQRREPLVLLILALCALVISGITPLERGTWWMEVFPIIIGFPILVATYRSFTLTSLTYRLIFLHALILMLGGHYTYAKVPLGFWIQDAFGFARNHYDRIGHFAQGFVPAMIVREILLRCTALRPGPWTQFLVACVCLAISACYEFIEWWAAVLLGSGADAFLGTQGDPWDTQWDMFLALVGAIVSLTLLSRFQDRQLQKQRAIHASNLYSQETR